MIPLKSLLLRLSVAITVAALPATVSVADPPPGTTEEEFTVSQELARELILGRQKLDQLIWQPEVEAQKYESRFVQLWDRLRAGSKKLQVLAQFPFQKLVLGRYESGEPLDLNIARYQFAANGQELTREQWQAFLLDAEKQGYEIAQTEWHHSRFDPPADTSPAKSEVNFVLHVAREEPAHRIIIRGVLDVSWQPENIVTGGVPEPAIIAVKEMELLERERPSAFREVFTVKGKKAKPRLLPLAVYDLDNDGLSEIILGGQNLIIRNQGNGEFAAEQFLKHDTSIFDAAILADFTDDGPVDFIAVDDLGALRLFIGDSRGRFLSPGVRISDDGAFTLPKVFTAGDIDADGDLDLYVANYKYAYRQGQWPTPYYDANDGYPAYLLRNDGNANFTDITEESGLAAKRFRRAYSGSLVDLDNDRDMDLIVVSDFAGFDTYLNDGQGKFSDVTDRFGIDRYFFGMSHTFGDYNLDGVLDFYVIGMSSTTAKRLEQMGIGRDDKPEHTAKRTAMGYGNRMFLGGQDFVRAPFNDSVARTGWSWGASSFDFDNDGDRDIFVANGHYSGKSAQDYCTTFWRHDIYADGSEDNLAKDIMFQTETTDLRNADVSWNGFEHKVLFMNRDGKDFINIAFLLGVAFEYDGRAVVTDDLDADGRVDLLVVEYKTEGNNNETFTLHVYQNQIQQAGHWIGVRLQDRHGFSPIGAVVKVMTDNGQQTDQIVTGDSFSSQHPATVHFGLGNASKVNAIEVQWANGAISRIPDPDIDRYLWIKPPG